MHFNNPRPCKFGEDCHKFKQGMCTFYHPQGAMEANYQPKEMGNGGGNWNPQNNNNRPCKYGLDCHKNKQGLCHFSHPPMSNDQNGQQGGMGKPPYNKQNNSFIHHQIRHEGYGSNNQNSGMQPNNNFNKKPQYQHNNFNDKNNNDLGNTLCRHYHLNMCKNGQGCKRKHYFIYDSPDKIKRINFMRDVPNQNISKLTKFTSGNKDYFALRLANVITFFSYNIQTQNLSLVFNWSLPELQQAGAKYNYYDHKNDYVYFSYSNPQTTLQEIGLFNLTNQKTQTISNSNKGRITGLAHYNQSILFSTSNAGQLKVWMKQGEIYKTNVQTNEKLRLYFNGNNAAIQLLFLDITQFNGVKITSIGTNDGRLLFFIGNDFTFNNVCFNNLAYLNVFGIKYTKKQQIPYAIVLAWNQQKTTSSLLQINLTNFQFNPIIQHDQQKGNICNFAFIQDNLLIGTLTGQLSIYKYPQCLKIGCIFHQNTIGDIIFAEELIVNTGVKLKYFMVLQKKTDQKEGSLGFYMLK